MSIFLILLHQTLLQLSICYLLQLAYAPGVHRYTVRYLRRPNLEVLTQPPAIGPAPSSSGSCHARSYGQFAVACDWLPPAPVTDTTWVTLGPDPKEIPAEPCGRSLHHPPPEAINDGLHPTSAVPPGRRGTPAPRCRWSVPPWPVTWHCMAAGPSATLAPGSGRLHPPPSTLILKAGINALRFQQSEILKQDFATMIDCLLDTEKQQIITGPLPPPRFSDIITSRICQLYLWLKGCCLTKSISITGNFLAFLNRHHCLWTVGQLYILFIFFIKIYIYSLCYMRSTRVTVIC